jgi:thioesterase domain-containing protein
MYVRARAMGWGSTLGHDGIVVPIQPAGEGRPLFLVPGLLVHPNSGLADAQFFSYIQLIRSLGGARPVYGLRTLGFGEFLDSHPSLEHLGAAFADAVRSLQPHGPYLIAGDCVGGILAYEVARQLSIGPAKVALVLFNTAYPDESRRRCIMTVVQARRSTRARVAALSGIFGRSWKQLKSIDVGTLRKIKVLFTKGLSFVNYRRSAECRFWERYSRDKAHLWDLILKYEPRPYDGEISLLMTEDVLEMGYAHGWEKVAGFGPELHRIPGNHADYLSKGARIVGGIIGKIADSIGDPPRSDRNAASRQQAAVDAQEFLNA